ncbi:unnamed protein product [Peniophora sp. CBMAI 1063]|nr:unnamed protein product [Peniophora sp. CBMAI 1063]
MTNDANNNLVASSIMKRCRACDVLACKTGLDPIANEVSTCRPAACAYSRFPCDHVSSCAPFRSASRASARFRTRTIRAHLMEKRQRRTTDVVLFARSTTSVALSRAWSSAVGQARRAHGDIKDFVITEESGIAKGIRRIIAVTGHEAASVTRTADTLESRLVSAENAVGKAKDAALKTLQVELGQADISLIRKNALRDKLASVREAFDKEPDEEAYFAVVPVDENVKILQAVVLSAKKLGKAVYVFSADAEGGKVAHVNHIPEFLRVPGFDGRSWAASVSEVIGGKAGGKEDGAQGVGTEVGKVQDAREVAEKAFRARK